MRLFFSAAFVSLCDPADGNVDVPAASGEVLLDRGVANSGSGVSDIRASRSRCSFFAFKSLMRFVTSVGSPSKELSITFACGSSSSAKVSTIEYRALTSRE
jgi:hypothetical protein